MSIETLLTEVRDALNGNTAAMKAMLAASGKAPAAGSTKTETKTETKTPPAKTPPAKASAKPKAMTAAAAAEIVQAFMKVEDADLRTQRKAELKQIIDHYGVERFTLIDPASFEEALGFLKSFEDGEDPFADGSIEEGDGDDAMV